MCTVIFALSTHPRLTLDHINVIERGKDNIQQQLPIAPSSFDIIYFRMRVLAIKAELWAGKHIRESVAKQRLRGNLHNFCNLCLSVGRLCVYTSDFICQWSWNWILKAFGQIDDEPGQTGRVVVKLFIFRVILQTLRQCSLRVNIDIV